MATPEIVEKRKNKQRAGIGNGIEAELIAEAQQVLESTPLANPAFYAMLARMGKDVAFEILATREITEKIVNSWLQNKNNIERVAKHRQKMIPEEGSDILDGWAALRMRNVKTSLHFAKPAQTVVLIAINQCTQENGFFTASEALEPGEDISLDGGQVVHVPEAGGALLIWITLNLDAREDGEVGA